MVVEFRAVEPHDAISSRPFCHVQRVVGGLEHCFAALDLRVWPGSDAEADRSLQRAAIERKCMRIDPLTQPLCKGDCGIEHGSWKQKEKFLAPVAPDPVDFPGFFHEDVGELL